MFFFSLLLLGLVCTSSPIVVMYMAISQGIFKAIGYDGTGDKFTAAVTLAVGWVAQGAQAMTPISHTMITMIFGFILNDFGVTISIARFSLIFMSWGLIYFLGIWIVFRYVIRPDVSKLKDLDIDAVRADLPPMDRREKIVAGVFIILVLFWISPDLLALVPTFAGFAAYIGKMGQTVPALVAVGVLCAIRTNGKPVLDLKDGSSKIMWGTVYLMAALMCFGYVFELENVGINQWMRNLFTPLTANLSAGAFVAMVIAFMLIATNFLSNAICVMLYTVVVPLASLIPGVSPIAIALIVASTANADSLLTPASCPVSGLMVSSGYVRPGFMAKYGWILMIFAFVGYIVIGYPLAVAIYG
jgi:sodium-dependent dicarboxylate transporter 2/3/5